MACLCRSLEKTGPVPQSGHRWNTRIAVALLAAALGATVAMAAVNYFRMVREEHKKYSNIRYEQVEEGYVPGEFVPYHLGYVPDGFTQTWNRTTGTQHRETYMNGKKGVSLSQIRIDKAEYDVDTEKVEPVEIILNETQHAWYLGNQSLKTIYWDDGTYFFIVSGHVSKEELVKIAESTTKK